MSVHGTDDTPTIDLVDAKKLFDQQEAVFVDVRDRDAYEQAHIPGAISIPLRELARRYAELPRDRRLVFY